MRAEQLGISRHCEARVSCPSCEGCNCACHAERLIVDGIVGTAALFDVTAAAARDLVAQLRSGHPAKHPLSLREAAHAVDVLLALGWRPTVGVA